MTWLLPSSVICGLLVLRAVSAGAQAIHLPPVYRPSIDPAAVVLTVRTTPLPGILGNRSTLYIHDGKLVITTPAKAPDVVLLHDRTLADVVHALETKYPEDLVVSSRYAQHSARLLTPTDTALTLSEEGVEIRANPYDPTIALGFGIVLAMSDAPSDQQTGLLSQAGFQLDVAGVHQVARQTAARTLRGQLFGPAFYVQARLGLNSDHQLEVSEESHVRGTQFEAALTQADQVALTGQADFVWPVGPASTRTELSLSLGYGVSWTQLEPFTFPQIFVGDSLRDAAGMFEPTLRARVEQHLNQTLPLTDASVTAVFRFRTGERPLFYVGAGFVNKEFIERHIRFERDVHGQPDPSSLTGVLGTHRDVVWRAIFGARVSGLLDVRLDATGPIAILHSAPTLRIVLGRDFPLVR